MARRPLSLARLAVALVISVAAACATGGSDLNLSDAALKARVEERLDARKDIDSHLVDVDAVSQVVTLSGVVNSWKTKQAAGQVAARTPGVKDVLNNLLIQE